MPSRPFLSTIAILSYALLLLNGTASAAEQILSTYTIRLPIASPGSLGIAGDWAVCTHATAIDPRMHAPKYRVRIFRARVGDDKAVQVAEIQQRDRFTTVSLDKQGTVFVYRLGTLQIIPVAGNAKEVAIPRADRLLRTDGKNALLLEKWIDKEPKLALLDINDKSELVNRRPIQADPRAWELRYYRTLRENIWTTLVPPLAYLNPSSGQLKSLAEQQQEVYGIHGDWLFSSGGPGYTVHLWNLSTGRHLEMPVPINHHVCFFCPLGVVYRFAAHRYTLWDPVSDRRMDFIAGRTADFFYTKDEESGEGHLYALSHEGGSLTSQPIQRLLVIPHAQATRGATTEDREQYYQHWARWNSSNSVLMESHKKGLSWPYREGTLENWKNEMRKETDQSKSQALASRLGGSTDPKARDMLIEELIANRHDYFVVRGGILPSLERIGHKVDVPRILSAKLPHGTVTAQAQTLAVLGHPAGFEYLRKLRPEAEDTKAVERAIRQLSLRPEVEKVLAGLR